MIKIKVDKGLVEYLGTNKIKLDEALIIYCFSQNKVSLLKTYLNNKTPDQCTAYLQSLERKFLLKKLSDIEDFDWDNYELTEVGHKIYSDIYEYLDSTLDIPKIVGEEVESKLAEFVTEWLALWPEGKNAAGERLRSNEIDVTSKMEKFMTKYKIKDRELIKQSTVKYLDRMKLNAYQYCTSAMYFIMKDGTSKLATECESSPETTSSAWEELA